MLDHCENNLADYYLTIKPPHYPDFELLKPVLVNCKKAFIEINSPNIDRGDFAFVAYDALKKTCKANLRQPDDWDDSQPFDITSCVCGYLKTKIKYCTIDLLERNAWNFESLESLEYSIPTTHTNRHEIIDTIENILTDDQLQVFNLWKQQYSEKEIAERIGKTRRQVSLIKTSIKKELKQYQLGDLIS